MFVFHAEFDPPPGWLSRTEAGLIRLAPPGDDTAIMLVFSVASAKSPAAWVENLLRTEAKGGFRVLEYAPRREMVSDSGLVGLVVELTGGFAEPDAPVERRAYVVFSDGGGKVLYPLALHASVATWDAVADAFFAAARTVRRPGPKAR